MNENLNNLETIREYLLRRISDEKTLEGIEELLFSDDEFTEKIELIEDELVNDFVFGKLKAKDSADFEKTLAHNSDRQLKVQVTQSLKVKVQVSTVAEKSSIWDSIKTFFSQPIYVVGLAILLVGILLGAILFSRSSNNSELAELKNIYQKERPTEARISQFDYAPYEVTRGENDLTDAEKRKLKLVENKLLEAIDKSPNANNYNALGVYYLTQGNYPEAIKELENAVNLEPKNARFHNDLGVALLESSKSRNSQDFISLTRANEEFSQALSLNSDFLEALFNKSMALQNLKLYDQAKKSWEAYLQKDPSSKWSVEARKQLEIISQNQVNLHKKKLEILKDFLVAYRNKDNKTVWNIHNSTKGTFIELTLAEQLTRRFLEARRNKDDPIAAESIEALIYIGNLEKEQHADFFFADLAEFYAKVDDEKIDNLLKAKDFLKEGRIQLGKNYNLAIENFENGKAHFLKANDLVEAFVAELWIGESMPDALRFDEGEIRLNALIENATQKKYQVILPSAFYWLAVGNYRKNNFSKMIKQSKRSLEIAQNTENLYQIKQSAEILSSIYEEWGETDKSIYYLGNIISNELYYRNIAQDWRILRLLAQFAEQLNFKFSMTEIAQERLLLSQEQDMSQTDAVITSMELLADSFVKSNKFAEALKLAEKSNQLSVEREQKASQKFATAFSEIERDKIQKRLKEEKNSVARNLTWSGELKRQTGNCQSAISDYQKAQDYYSEFSQITYNLLNIQKGKLQCFQQLQLGAEFESELDNVIRQIEEYRNNIREDESRQSFFENEQFIFDLAIENSLRKGEIQKAFDLTEISRSRSLLDFIKSEKSIKEIENDFGDVAKPYNLKEIQAGISSNLQIIQYALLPEKLVIWKITKNNFETTERIISQIELEKKVRLYQELILQKDSLENLQKESIELYKLLIPNSLDKDKAICLIPDKSLHQIAFASLLSPQGKYLIEDYSILYSPSSSVLLATSENAKTKNESENLLIFGNPKFDSAENASLRDLPEAELETKEISKDYPKHQKYIGIEATKEMFVNNLQNAEIIHFAGHFVANQKSSGNSKMLFSNDDLFAFELGANKLPEAKLVVLSACDTKVEKLNKSEGAIGIARAFLAMGTPLVIASSWKVDSEAAKNLMVSFHKKRRVEKLSSLEALRQSQLEMLRTPNLSSPYYWSAFSATGGFVGY